jgi:hypothetical protein
LVRVPAPRTKQRTVWTVDDARRYLESSRDSADPLHAAYVLLLVFGLRRGDVPGLRWSAVDLDLRETRVWPMQILRHSQFAVTMDIYSQVASASTREALSKLGSRLDLEAR